MTLVADVMLLNNIPFLNTMSCGIKFATVEHIPSRRSKQLRKKLKIIMDLYSRESMIVQTILMDLRIDSTKYEVMGK